MVIEQVFEQVSKDPCELDDAGLDAGLRACARGRSYLDGREAVLLAEVRKRKAGTSAGVVDTAKILKDTAGVSGHEARKRAKLAHELERLPRVADGLANGDLNLEQAGMLAATHAELPKQAEVAEAELVEMATGTPPERLRHQLQTWRNAQRGDDGQAEFDKKRCRRKASIFETDEGLVGLFAQLDPVAGDEVHKAIEWHAARLWRHERGSDIDTHIPRSKRPQLFADALVEMARRSMSQSNEAESAPPHASVVAIISLEWLLGRLDIPGVCELSDGTPIPVTVVRQMAAKVGIIPMVMDTGGTVLDMGRRSRAATDDQKLALLVRDGPCAIPGCDSLDASFTHAHHIKEWSVGGASDLENLANACIHDHRRIHAVRPSASLTEFRLRRNIAAAGWATQQHDDHTWWLHRPDGAVRPSASLTEFRLRRNIAAPHRQLRQRRPPPTGADEPA